MVAFDVIGVLVTYYTELNIPYWVYIALFVVAIFWGGFNIYRQGTAEIRIEFSKRSKLPECICLSNEDLMFDIAIPGYIANFGPQSGILESVTGYLYSNHITDAYVLNRIYTYQVLPIHKGNISPHFFHEGTYKKSAEHFALPFVLTPSQIEPFTLGIRLRVFAKFAQDKDKALEGFIEWIKHLELSLTYVTRQSNGTQEQKTSVKIDPAIIKDAFESSLDRIKSLRTGAT